MHKTDIHAYIATSTNVNRLCMIRTYVPSCQMPLVQLFNFNFLFSEYNRLPPCTRLLIRHAMRSIAICDRLRLINTIISSIKIINSSTTDRYQHFSNRHSQVKNRVCKQSKTSLCNNVINGNKFC